MHPSVNRPSACYFRIGALVVLYVISGWLGLQLAIPPGYVTAVFPPAGLALGAMLLWGWRVWPGVFLGATALNLIVAASSGHLSLVGIGLAIAIAIGSTLQCSLGRWLIDHYLPRAKTLEKAEPIIGMMLLGGPLACVVASTWGSLALLALGKIGV